MALYDLLIVGAGIIGANAAFLARKKFPAYKIGLIDRKNICSGASAYSAGVDLPISKTESHLFLTERSRTLYKKYYRTFKVYPKKDIITYWLVEKNSLADFKKKVIGNKLSVCSPNDNEILKKNSIILKNDTVALKQTGNSYCDVKTATKLLANNAAVDLILNNTISKLKTLPNNNVMLIGNNESYFETKAVILTTGPWKSLAAIDPRLEISRKKVASVVINVKPNDNDPLIVFADSGNFLLPVVEHNHWLFSFTSNVWGCDPENANFSLSEDEKIYINHFLSTFAPAFAHKIKAEKVFCDFYKENRIPTVFCESAAKNIISIQGCSGSGYRLAPALADLATDML